MDKDKLAESTLHPDSNRTLLRYTVEDMKKEVEAIRYIESNKSVLNVRGKVSRFDLLG